MNDARNLIIIKSGAEVNVERNFLRIIGNYPSEIAPLRKPSISQSPWNHLLTEVEVCSATRGISHRMWRAGTTRLGNGHSGMSDTPTAREEITNRTSIHLLINPFHGSNDWTTFKPNAFTMQLALAVPKPAVVLHDMQTDLWLFSHPTYHN